MIQELRGQASEEMVSLIEATLCDIALSLRRIANVMDPSSLEDEPCQEEIPAPMEEDLDGFSDGPAPELRDDQIFPTEDLVLIAKKFISLSGPSKAGDIRRYLEVATQGKVTDATWTMITKSLKKTGDRATTRWDA